MAKFFDTLFATILIFVLTFAWAAYCLRNATTALILALIVALCACYLIFTLLKSMENRKFIKRKKKKELNDFAIYLQFNCDNSALFMQMLRYYNFISKSINYDNIIVTKNTTAGSVFETTNAAANNLVETKSDRCWVAICFESDTVKLPQLRNAIISAKRNNCEKLMVFGVKADNDALTIANSQFPTKFVDLQNTYALFENSETLPKVPQSKTIKQRILPQYAFNKRRFGWYFTGAVFLFFMSFVSYFKLYNLLWATALAGVALYCLLNKRYNKIPTNVKLE